ncbi:unnamed protein product [Gongylonema pulchrum]|uniref:Secreted protein n=1 Tax=Gongylonema pulchrum TaxID=637853 RepID=A0A183E8K5_9BILA|nr:unnamed protein product [Gongylonema pulchrum]
MHLHCQHANGSLCFMRLSLYLQLFRSLSSSYALFEAAASCSLKTRR